MRRGGELRRTQMPARKTPMPRVSTRTTTKPVTAKARRAIGRAAARSTNDFSPAAKRAMDTRSGGWCEWPGSLHRATDRAHRENRNPRNGHASNGLMLCRAHHVRSHDHRIEANDLGVRVSDGHDYRAIPVLTRHSPLPIWLFDNGEWTSVAPIGATP